MLFWRTIRHARKRARANTHRPCCEGTRGSRSRRDGNEVSDAVRILLTRTANEGALPFALAANAANHDAWFRAKVQEALDHPPPAISHEQVEAHFAERRAAAILNEQR